MGLPETGKRADEMTGSAGASGVALRGGGVGSSEFEVGSSKVVVAA